MRFLTIISLVLSINSFAEDKEYPLGFLNKWKETISFPTNFVVTSSHDRAKYLSKPSHIHSNEDIRLLRTGYIDGGGESLFAFFNPQNDSEIIFILHVHPEDPDTYDFLMTKNEKEGVWERAPESVFPKGNLETFSIYLYEKTGQFIVFDRLKAMP